MGTNMFNENVDYLYQVQTDLEAVEELKRELSEYKIYEKNLKKSIVSEEKSIQDEIAQLIKKRKQEREKVYDQQIDVNKNKNKDVRLERDKAKTKRVDERVLAETADLIEDNRRCQVEMKTIFKAQHVPSFCMSNWFYALFMPKRAYEYVTMLLVLLFTYIGIPFLVYYIALEFLVKNKSISVVISSSIGLLAVLFFVIHFTYILIINKVKVKHYATLMEACSVRETIAANKRQMKAIRNRINRDKDDSGYGLEKYDDKLAGLDKELEEISKEKQEAMTDFENNTKQLLIDEVNDRRLGKVEEMKSEIEELKEKIVVLEEDIKSSSIAITNNYGVILGKEFCNPSKVSDLISLMEEGAADTVSEAIETYKNVSK